MSDGTYWKAEEFPNPGHVTKVWNLYTRGGSEGGVFFLGRISWYAAWRKYCFFPHHPTVFEQVCLREIANFCEMKTKERKAERDEDSGTNVLRRHP